MGQTFCSTCHEIVANAEHRCVCTRCGVVLVGTSGLHQERECIATLRAALGVAE